MQSFGGNIAAHTGLKVESLFGSPMLDQLRGLFSASSKSFGHLVEPIARELLVKHRVEE